MKRHLFCWLLLALLALPPALPAKATETAPSTTGVTSLPSDIPVRRDTPANGTDGGRTVFVIWSLLALGALVWVSVRWSRRHQKNNPAAPARSGDWKQGIAQLFGRTAVADLRVLSSVRVGARHSVHVVAWQRKEYLLGSSEQGLTMLDQRQLPEGSPSSEPAAR